MSTTCHGPWVILFLLSGMGLTFSSVCAKDAMLVGADGQKTIGRVASEDDQQIALKIDGQSVSFDKANLTKIRYLDNATQLYLAKLSLISPDDLEGRYNLAHWLYKQRQAYQPALLELKKLAKLAPDNERVTQLMKIIQTRLKLRKPVRRKSKPALRQSQPRQADVPVVTAPQAVHAGDSALPRLSAKAMNVMRVLMVDLDEKPAVHIPRETLDIFLKDYTDGRFRSRSVSQKFRGAKGYLQLSVIFDATEQYPQVRQMYQDIVVRKDPPIMRQFRSQIHRKYVLNYCATASCHGSSDPEQSGSFRLIYDKPNSPETAYTNFFLINTYRSPNKYEMLDDGNPQASILYQYGLSSTQATLAHPSVPQWKAMPGQTKRAGGNSLLRWIDSLQSVSTRSQMRKLIAYRGTSIGGGGTAYQDGQRGKSNPSGDPKKSGSAGGTGGTGGG